MRTMNLEEIWKSALGEIEVQISKPNFLTWFKNSRLIDKKDGVALVGLQSNFAKEYVQDKYYKTVLGAVRNLDDSTKKIDFIVHNNVDLAAKISESKLKTAAPTNQQTFNELKIDPESGLNPRYSFNSFVVGSSNEMAYAAAQSILKDVGRKYNPLFLYGGVGVGKTHLIQAIGNEARNLYQNRLKIKYVPSEKFTNEVIWAIRNKKMDTIRERYRLIDILIIDDIQFIGGKPSTEMEFFNTFNALYENNKQVIISSDRPPSHLPILEERMKSRFEGGMICDIGLPDYELRVAVLQAKAQERGVNIPQDVLDLVSNKVKKNLRELEGVLNRIIFYQQAKNQEITVKIAEQIINENIQSPIQQNLNPNQLIKVVAEFFDVPLSDITGRCRKREIVEPRQIAMYLLRDVLDLSFPFIGEKLGKRDHTTAMYAFEKISQDVNKNQQLNNKIMMIKEKLTKN